MLEQEEINDRRNFLTTDLQTLIEKMLGDYRRFLSHAGYGPFGEVEEIALETNLWEAVTDAAFGSIEEARKELREARCDDSLWETRWQALLRLEKERAARPRQTGWPLDGYVPQDEQGAAA